MAIVTCSQLLLTYRPVDVDAVGNQNAAQLDAALGPLVEQLVAGHGPVYVQLDLLQDRLGVVVEWGAAVLASGRLLLQLLL